MTLSPIFFTAPRKPKQAGEVIATAVVSKLNSLCRMTLDREMSAPNAIDMIEQSVPVEYEVIPL